MKYTKDDFLTTITGFLMAAGGSVPGVSGGTIAYALGKYDEFVHAIAALSRKSTSEERKAGIIWLIKLLVGSGLGMLVAVLLITDLVVQKPYELSSLFIGFVVVSIPFVIKNEKITKEFNLKNIIGFLIGLGVVLLLSTMNVEVFNVGDSHNLFTYVYVFVVAMISICAMVLPGVSGSTFLLIFGMYVPIFNTVREVLGFNFQNLDIFIIFGLGVLVGILFFSKAVKYLFNHHRVITVFVILGMMVGSIYSIIIGPEELTDAMGNNLNLSPVSFHNFNIIWFGIGIVLIVLLEQLKNRIEKTKNNQ